MSYLKSLATSFVYIAFFLAVITFAPGLPPIAEFSEYSIKPPADLTGVLAPNDRLNSPGILFNGEIKGPESFDSYNGELYTGMHGGNVGKIVGNKIFPVVKFGNKCHGLWDEKQCGRPLGLKFDKQGRLYVADSYYGIFIVDVKTGKYDKLFDASQPIDGKPPNFINSLDVANNGDVYWTDSSTEFKLYDGIYVTLADPSGRLIRFNAATKKNEVLAKNLGLPNGVHLSDDESYLIVAETMKSSLFKYHLKGPKAGKHQVLVDGLPGAPDNIHTDGQGNFLVSLVATADPEHPEFSQTLTAHPYVRKMLARLLSLAEIPFKLLDDVYPNDFAKKIVHAIGSFETSRFMHPKKVTVLRIDGNGQILDALHNSDEKISGISSAYIHDNFLWLGSPWNEYLAKVPIKQAFPNTVFAQKLKDHVKVTRQVPEVGKPVTAPIEIEKPTSSKPPVKTTAPPTPTKAPEVPKTEKVKSHQAEKKHQLPEKVETPQVHKKEIPVRENEAPKPSTQTAPKKSANKMENVKQELPKPLKQEASKKPVENVRKTTQESMKQTKQADTAIPTKPKQPETAKTARKVEPTKRSTKIADEI